MRILTLSGAIAFSTHFTSLDAQGIYCGGPDDGYDSITLEWEPTARTQTRQNGGFPTVLNAGEKVAFPLRETAVLVDATGKTAAVFGQGPEFSLPADLAQGIYFFVYLGEGRRVQVRNGREK